MNGRHLSLAKEVHGLLMEGYFVAARKLIDAAILQGSTERFDVWDIEVAVRLYSQRGGRREDNEEPRVSSE